MIINGLDLINAWPLEPMLRTKEKAHGVSYGLSEAGYDVRIAQTVTLSGRSRFALASTFERFQMPDNLVGIVHDKSTWARQGLSVFNTVIEPGFFGGLTLELVYHGSGTIVIPEGAGIAQVVFHEVSRPVKYSGKYQNQQSEPQAAIFE
jgi:dCTP deaminase